MKLDKNDILGYECRHAIHSVSENGNADIHLVKEYIHLKDGSVRMNKRFIRNYERPYWVTKEAYRNHTDKKEYEDEDKLMKFMSPQWKLNDSISRSLYKRPAGRTNLKQLSESPYLYGSDVLTSCLIKYDYAKRWPEIQPTRASLGVIDIEADVVNGTDDVIIISLTYRDKAIVVVNTTFLPPTRFNIEKIHQKINEHLGEVVQKRNIKYDLVFEDTPAKCCIRVIEKAHEWSPDFIAIWNINYDIPKIVATLEKEGYDPKDVFSDPALPKEFRHFKYIEGKAQKVTQSGKQTPKHWADIWHTVECPSTFYFLDAGVVYKFLRIANGMEPSYALDDVLKRHIGVGKLKIKECEHLTKLSWHIAMQSKYPHEYVAYNMFDDIGVELLNDKEEDISGVFPVLCEFSDYRHFNRNPRKIVDDLHFFYRERGKVIATTGMEVEVDDDDLVISLKGWIATLNASLMEETGLSIFEELPWLNSLIFIHNAD